MNQAHFFPGFVVATEQTILFSFCCPSKTLQNQTWGTVNSMDNPSVQLFSQENLLLTAKFLQENLKAA